jgi:hypothetical protein
LSGGHGIIGQRWAISDLGVRAETECSSVANAMVFDCPWGGRSLPPLFLKPKGGTTMKRRLLKRLLSFPILCLLVFCGTALAAGITLEADFDLDSDGTNESSAKSTKSQPNLPTNTKWKVADEVKNGSTGAFKFSWTAAGLTYSKNIPANQTITNRWYSWNEPHFQGQINSGVELSLPRSGRWLRTRLFLEASGVSW